VVDEAFMDAVPGEAESLARRSDLPGLIVVRSLTKTWGLAGLRVGYVLAEADVVTALARAQPLWSVSTPALVAAEACSTPTARAEAAAMAVTCTAELGYLEHRLGGLALSLAAESRGPFVLVHVPGGRHVRAALRRHGYAVRRGDSFPGLGPDWLRIAVRDRATTDGLVAALRELL
jgi:histidinol-phosphate aminotransferase